MGASELILYPEKEMCMHTGLNTPCIVKCELEGDRTLPDFLIEIKGWGQH